jgi:hypothetical protein
MIVRDAVDNAIDAAHQAYTMGGDEEPFNKVSFARIVALQAIANVLETEFSEVASQYLAQTETTSHNL